MTVFYREGRGWCAKFVVRGKQRWVPGGPWSTRGEAEEAERRDRERVQGPSPQAMRMRWAKEEADKRLKRSRPHTVYSLFAGDDLLYVGITSEGMRRLGKHRLHRPWWSEVTRATFEHVENADEAEALEAKLIVELHPRHNKRGRIEALPDGMVGADRLGEWLGFSAATIRNMASEGLLPVAGRTDHGTPYFDLDAVDVWCHEGRAARLPVADRGISNQNGSSAVSDAGVGV